jgi:hypothetical protein
MDREPSSIFTAIAAYASVTKYTRVSYQVEAELPVPVGVLGAALGLEPLRDDEDGVAGLVAKVLSGEEDAATERISETHFFQHEFAPRGELWPVNCDPLVMNFHPFVYS